MSYYVLAAGTDADGLLTKNFISRLCNGDFMGKSAATLNYASLRLDLTKSAEIVSLLSNNSNDNALNLIALNNINNGVFIIADPTSLTFQEDVYAKLNHLINLCDKFTTPFPIYIIGMKADLLTPEQIAEKHNKLEQCKNTLFQNPSDAKIMIKYCSIVSAKTGAGFDELKGAVLSKDIPSTPSIKDKATKSWYHVLNPLSSVLESYNHPHARTLRTSLKQKLKDSFFVFSGKPDHLGLFDFLILPALVKLSLNWAVEQLETMPMMVVPVILLNIINFPLAVVKCLLAALATVVFSPITIAVHCISSLIAHKFNKRALRLMGESSDGNQSLDDFLTQKELDIENLVVSIEPMASSYKLMFTEKSSERFVSRKNKDEQATFSVYMDEPLPKHAKNLNALFNLNIGAVVTNIEKYSDLDEVAIASLLSK